MEKLFSKIPLAVCLTVVLAGMFFSLLPVWFIRNMFPAETTLSIFVLVFSMISKSRLVPLFCDVSAVLSLAADAGLAAKTAIGLRHGQVIDAGFMYQDSVIFNIMTAASVALIFFVTAWELDSRLSSAVKDADGKNKFRLFNSSCRFMFAAGTISAALVLMFFMCISGLGRNLVNAEILKSYLNALSSAAIVFLIPMISLFLSEIISVKKNLAGRNIPALGGEYGKGK